MVVCLVFGHIKLTKAAVNREQFAGELWLSRSGLQPQHLKDGGSHSWGKGGNVSWNKILNVLFCSIKI